MQFWYIGIEKKINKRSEGRNGKKKILGKPEERIEGEVENGNGKSVKVKGSGVHDE